MAGSPKQLVLRVGARLLAPEPVSPPAVAWLFAAGIATTTVATSGERFFHLLRPDPLVATVAAVAAGLLATLTIVCWLGSGRVLVAFGGALVGASVWAFRADQWLGACALLSTGGVVAISGTARLAPGMPRAAGSWVAVGLAGVWSVVLHAANLGVPATLAFATALALSLVAGWNEAVAEDGASARRRGREWRTDAAFRARHRLGPRDLVRVAALMMATVLVVRMLHTRWNPWQRTQAGSAPLALFLVVLTEAWLAGFVPTWAFGPLLLGLRALFPVPIAWGFAALLTALSVLLRPSQRDLRPAGRAVVLLVFPFVGALVSLDEVLGDLSWPGLPPLAGLALAGLFWLLRPRAGDVPDEAQAVAASEAALREAQTPRRVREAANRAASTLGVRRTRHLVAIPPLCAASAILVTLGRGGLPHDPEPALVLGLGLAFAVLAGCALVPFVDEWRTRVDATWLGPFCVAAPLALGVAFSLAAVTHGLASAAVGALGLLGAGYAAVRLVADRGSLSAKGSRGWGAAIRVRQASPEELRRLPVVGGGTPDAVIEVVPEGGYREGAEGKALAVVERRR